MTTRNRPIPAKKKEKKMSKYLGRDDIKTVEDVTYRDVDVVEWGGTIRLRSLTGDQAGQFIGAQEDLEARRKSIYRALALSLVDEAGVRICGDEDAEWLEKKSMVPLMRIGKIINELNGFTEEAKDVAKNDSGGTEPAASSSV